MAAVGCGTAATAGRSPAGPSSTDARRSGGWEVQAARSEDDFAGGVSMRAQQGSIDREDAEEAINRNFARLSRCYEEAGEARDFAGGAVTLRFLIGLDGRTREVSVIESGLGSLEVERCLRQAALGIRFPRPHGHAAATFEYSLEFKSTGEVPVVELPADATRESLPPLLVRLAASCKELGVDQLQATLYIDRTGTVRSVGLAAARPISEAAASCVAGAIRQTRMPVQTLSGASAGRGAGRSAAVGRTLIALSNQDVLHPPVLAVKKSSGRARHQGRRPRVRR